MAFSSTGQEFQHIGDILKNYYAPAIVNQVYKKAPFWAQIKKLTKGVYGKAVIIPVQTAFTEAVGARTANDYTLPTSQRNTYDEATILMKRNYGRIQVDGFAIESAKGKGGWVDIVTAETKGVSNAFALDIDRQSLGRGDAVLGHEAGGGSSSQTLVVDNPFGFTIASDARLFRVGMYLDAYDKTDNTEHIFDALITAISSNSLTISGDTVGSIGDGDIICRKDTFSTTIASIGEMMGLDGLVSASNYPSPSAGTAGSTFQNIASSSGDYTWKSYVSSTSQVISETVIQELLDNVEKNTDGSDVNLCLTTYAIRNKLVEIMQGDRMLQTMDLKAGWKALKYIGGNIELPIMVHKNLLDGHFYVVSTPHIKFYTLKKLVWDNKGGGIVKPVAGYDAYEAWFKMYGNLGTDCRNAHGKLTGVTTS